MYLDMQFASFPFSQNVLLLQFSLEGGLRCSFFTSFSPPFGIGGCRSGLPLVPTRRTQGCIMHLHENPFFSVATEIAVYRDHPGHRICVHALGTHGSLPVLGVGRAPSSGERPHWFPGRMRDAITCTAPAPAFSLHKYRN